MSLEEKIRRFNPNDAATNDSNLFGLPFAVDEARVVIVPVPWEVTVSCGGGNARKIIISSQAPFQSRR
jgi:agmatinase